MVALVLGACGGERPTAIYELTTYGGKPVPVALVATSLDTQWVVAGEIRVSGSQAIWRQHVRFSPPASDGVTDRVSASMLDWRVRGDSVQLWPHCPIGVDCFGWVGTLDGRVLSLNPAFAPPGTSPLMEFQQLSPP